VLVRRGKQNLGEGGQAITTKTSIKVVASISLYKLEVLCQNSSYFKFVGGDSSTKYVLLLSKKVQNNYSKCSTFASSVLLHLFSLQIL